MSTLRIHLSNDQYEKLKLSAEKRNISVGKLMDKLATVILANYETQMRFELRPTHHSIQSGLEELINTIDS